MCCVPLHHDPGGASQAVGGVAIARVRRNFASGPHDFTLPLSVTADFLALAYVL